MKISFINGVKKGLSLIEAIIGIVIVGIAFYPVLMSIMHLMPHLSNNETMTQKIFLAQEKSEEFMAKRFSNLNANFAPASFEAPFNDYWYEATVNYVDPANLTIPVAGATHYKVFTIKVWKLGDISGTVEIASLLTENNVVSTEVN